MKLWTAMLYAVARWEVTSALCANKLAGSLAFEDGLPPELIPSVSLRGLQDRVLAEIDQDGYLFAADEHDEPFFNKRKRMVPRTHHRVRIVLSSGAVRLQKSAVRRATNAAGRLRDYLQWEFYMEAAALLRLRGVTGVPLIRRLDVREGMIEMDYIWGQDLRQIFAGNRSEIDYDQISRIFGESLADQTSPLSRDAANLVARAASSGVIARDLPAGNFVRAFRSQSLYLVDFNLIYLRPVPGWRIHLRNLPRLLQASIH